jgi:hypothetical protein
MLPHFESNDGEIEHLPRDGNILGFWPNMAGWRARATLRAVLTANPLLPRQRTPLPPCVHLWPLCHNCGCIANRQHCLEHVFLNHLGVVVDYTGPYAQTCWEPERWNLGFARAKWYKRKSGHISRLGPHRADNALDKEPDR